VNQDQLFEYATEGNLIKLGQIIGEADLAAADADGMTPLMHACANDHYAVAGLFIGKGAETLDMQDNSGKTALMHAAAAGANKIVKTLIKAGASIDTVDNEGNTASDHAQASGDAKTIKRLSN
jgi:ankyrin repeat protein